jgi:cytochrome b
MVVALLVALSVQAISGLFGNDEIFNIGPLAGYISTDLSLQLTTLHRRLFYWIAAAAAIHVLAVIAHYVFSRENLILAMITGRKPHHTVPKSEGIASSRVWLATLLIIALTVALSWIVIHAPLPIDADS